MVGSIKFGGEPNYLLERQEAKGPTAGYRLEIMDVCSAFNRMDDLFKGGLLRQLGWEGDADQGWAERVPTNQGSLVHTFQREFPVKCYRCGERVWEDQMPEHLMDVCPARPALMGTVFRDKIRGAEYRELPKTWAWDEPDPVPVQKPKAEPKPPRPEFTKEHVQQMLRRVGEEALDDVDWAELMMPPPFRGGLSRGLSTKLEPGTVKPRPGPRTAVVDGVQMCWGYDRAKRGFGMVPVPCLMPDMPDTPTEEKQVCASAQVKKKKKRKKRRDMGYHPAFKKKE